MERSGESELRRYIDCQRKLAERLIDGDSLEEVAPDFLSIVAGLLRWEAGAMWEVVEATPALRFVCGWSVPELDAEPLWRVSRELEFRAGVGIPGRAWASGRIDRTPAHVDSPDRFPRLDAALDLGLRAAMAIPIAAGPGKEVLAVAELQTLEFNDQSELLAELVESFAEQLAAFILRRRSEARIRAAEADTARLRSHFAEVVAGSQDAVLSKDLEGILTSWNPAAERLYGYTAEEAIGRHISFIVPPDHEHEEQRILDLIRSGRRLETYETDRIRADGAAHLGLAHRLADPRARRRADRRLGDRPRHHRREAAT